MYEETEIQKLMVEQHGRYIPGNHKKAIQSNSGGC